MNTREYFENTPVRKLFFRTALPGALSMLVQNIYFIIDGIFIGRLLGETAFSALNIALPFTMVAFAIADMIGVGSSVVIAVHLGKHEYDKASEIFTMSTVLIILGGCLTGSILYIFAPQIIALTNADGNFAYLAVQYLRTYVIFCPAITIVFAMDNYLRICGKVTASFILNILVALGSIFFDFIFLYLFRWGIWAASLAGALGMLISAMFAYGMFLSGKLQLKYVKFKFDFKIIKEIIANGISTFLSNISSRVTSVVINSLLIRYGGEMAIAIYGCIMNVDALVFTLIYGMVDSQQPAISYNWGARLLDRVKQFEKYCFSTALIISFTVCCFAFGFPRLIIMTFLKDVDASFLLIAIRALKLYMTGFFVRWFVMSTSSFMLAIEKYKYATLISLSTSLIFPLLGVVVLSSLQLDGLWLNFSFTSVMALLLSFVILYKERNILKENNAY